MPNTYRSNIDFINFLPKREDWQLTIRDGLFSFGGAFLLDLKVNWLLGLRVAILRWLKPEFVAVKIYVKSKEEVEIAVRHLKNVSNLRGLWIYDVEGGFLIQKWAELKEVEYLFLKGCNGDFDSIFLDKFKKNKNTREINFGVSISHPNSKKYDFSISKEPHKDINNLDRLELIKSTKGVNVFIAFPSKSYTFSRNLIILKQVCGIAGLGTIIEKNRFKIILHSGDNNWHLEYSDISFHTYITETELKEWVFELFNFTKSETQEDIDFSILTDFFASKQVPNILIALNILKHNEGIDRDTFAIVVGLYQSYARNNSTEDNLMEIKKLLEEIMIKYVPAPISTNLKNIQSKSSTNKNGVLNIELFQFFKDFNVNVCQIQRCLLFDGPYEFHFLINLDKGEELPDLIEQLKPDIHSFLNIRFIGKGNITPTLNKISNSIKNPFTFNIFSTEKDGLDIGLSEGKVIASRDTLTFSNFYCSDNSKIHFSNVKTLEWKEGGNLMRNISECFPDLSSLSITKSQIDRFDLSSAKETLNSVNFSETDWSPSFNQHLKDLVNLKFIGISKARLKVIPKEILNLKELQTIYLSGNLINEFPISFFTLEKLKLLNLAANKISKLPSALEFPNLEEIRLFQNEFNILNFSTDNSPKLKTVHLGWSNVLRLHSGFFNKNLRKKINFMMMRIQNVELPPINQINISSEECLATFNFRESIILNYDRKKAYQEKYPDNFKF